jgi:hypothetical protein
MAGVGTSILASDYNNIQTKIAGVMGVGSGQSGYNQTLSSAQVGNTDAIRATQWTALRNDLLRARQHQTGTDQSANLVDVTASTTSTFTGYIIGTTLTIVSLTSGSVQKGQALYGLSGQITPGTVITSGFGTAWTVNNGQTVGSSGSPITINGYLVVTDLFLTEYGNFADACVTSKLTVAANQITTGEAFTTNTNTSAWNGTKTNEVTITFPSATAARAYFNAGGDFRITASRTGGTNNTKNSTWTAMISSDTVTYPNAAGTVTFNYSATTRSGTGTAYSIGFYGLTSSYQTIFDKPAPAGAYSENHYVIYAKCDVASNASGGATQVIFSIQFQDSDPGGDGTGSFGPPPYGPGVDESPDGTLVSAIGMGRPTGTNVSCPAPTPVRTTVWS